MGGLSIAHWLVLIVAGILLYYLIAFMTSLAQAT